MPPEMLTTGEHFALEVRGDPMIEAGILRRHGADPPHRQPTPATLWLH
jgi:SOS-response transcriptional repressor LexA